MKVRRQLSLFLPEPERTVVDAVRSQYDPIQFNQIPAHVTLCREHEVEDLDVVWTRVAELVDTRVQFDLGEPECLADQCVLIPVIGATAQFDDMREWILGRVPAQMRPHITLIHPRNATGSMDALESVRCEPLPRSVVLREIMMIEQVEGESWRVLETHRCDKQSPSTKRVFAYRINSENRLESVNSDWLSFARENRAPHLSAATVIGQPLFQFVTGEETQMLYRMIIDRVRQTQLPVAIPFRCDGPCTRRFMELTVSPCPGGDLQFTGRLIREEKREPVPLFDPAASRTEEFLIVCSWCKRVEVSERWLDVELAVSQLDLFDETCLPQISHGVCAECAERLELEFAEGK